MLHLHALVWVTGNVAFRTLCDQIQNNGDFANRMIQYLESIILQSIDSSINENTEIGLGCAPPSSKDQESDYEFYIRLAADSNAVASKAQVHSSKHNTTCFKYHQKGQGKDACRFGMPQELVPNSYIDRFGVIHLL